MNILKIKSVQLKSIAAILILLLSFQSCKESEGVTPEATGSDAPAFTLKSVEGNDVSLSDYSGKVVVLYFFGSSCPLCKAAAPDIEMKLNKAFAGNGDYQILGLDQWNGNEVAVDAFMKSTGVTFPLLLDAANVAKDYNTTYDRIVVIDKTGKVVFSGTQNAASDLDQVVMKVTDLLAAEPKEEEPVVTKGNAPAFSLNALGGNSVSLSDYAGKVTVLFFFGNTCPYCIAAGPSIKSKLVTPYSGNSDYAIVGLDVWNGSDAKVSSFKTQSGLDITMLLNASAVASDYSTTYDRLVVVDQKGDVVFTGSKNASGDVDAVKQKVDMLLAK